MSAHTVFGRQTSAQQPAGPASDPNQQHIQQGYQEALEFQRWVSEQSQVLGRLKVFHTMAKSINDQQ